MGVRIRVEPSTNRYAAERMARQYAPGVLIFEEITVPVRDVQVGDQTQRESGWERVTQTHTSMLVDPRTGEKKPPRTRIYVGASDWTAHPADDMITVRRYVGPAPVETAEKENPMLLTPKRLDALRTVAANPGRVVAHLRVAKGYMTINGHAEGFLSREGLIIKSAQPVETQHRNIRNGYGKTETVSCDVHVWEITAKGLSVLRENETPRPAKRDRGPKVLRDRLRLDI